MRFGGGGSAGRGVERIYGHGEEPGLASCLVLGWFLRRLICGMGVVTVPLHVADGGVR